MTTDNIPATQNMNDEGSTEEEPRVSLPAEDHKDGPSESNSETSAEVRDDLGEDEEDELSDDDHRELACIEDAVQTGLFSPEEILEMVDDPDKENRLDWWRGWIADLFRDKAKDEKNWPAVTDVDRLMEVLRKLEELRILVVRGTRVSSTWCRCQAEETYKTLGGSQSGLLGYCYFNGQDVDNALESGELYLGYGHFSDPIKTIEIARRVLFELEAAGFDVEWNGSISSRIKVKGIRWQYRMNPEYATCFADADTGQE